MVQENSEMYVPRVSVIIPLYNKQDTIARALDSVLAQTVQDFEIIVVGGKSEDGGEDIVKGYNDSRIKLIPETGCGVSEARNQGVSNAKAELVAFLDADDEWLPRFLEIILSLKEKYPDSGLYGAGYRKILPSGVIEDVTYQPSITSQEITNFFEVICESFAGSKMLCLTSGMAIPKSVFLEVGGFPMGYSQSEDRCLRGRIALHHTVAYAPEIAAIYYLDPHTYESRFTQYVSDPFSDYIYDLDQTELQKRSDYFYLMLFADYGRSALASVNLSHNHDKKKVREVVRTIRSPHFYTRKMIMYLATYLPDSCLRVAAKIYRQYQKSQY